MSFDERQIARLITRPSEVLNAEVKTWIDPHLPHGIAKLVEVKFALRDQKGA